jgi:uncharacterized membrane protein YdjX (TVP38/TMEM64 family)
VTSFIFESSTALLEQAGFVWAALVVMFIFVFGALVAVPRPLLSIICGLIFGWWGLPLAVVSAALGAALVFAVGRHLLRPRVSARLARNRLAHAALQAVDLEGFRAVVLLRMSPLLPSSVQSYMFSVTSLTFTQYFVGTVLGTFPAIAIQVWTGTLGRAALAGEVAPGTMALWSIGVVALVAATFLIGVRIRRLLAADAGEACRAPA